MSESVILCEGYHDRAFWAGWLEYLGCEDPGRSRGNGNRVAVLDPWGKKVVGGEFAFHSKAGKFIRVVPCGSDSRAVGRQARKRLGDEQQRMQQGASRPRLHRLVLNVDPDVQAGDASPRTGFRQQDLRALAEKLDPATVETEDGDLAMFDGATAVSLVRWETDDPPLPGVPTQQTLERLVCAAFAATYPDRGPVVDAWLESRPEPPPSSPKEPAMSYMAGWYADTGSDGFYRVTWDRGEVVDELRSRLRQCGAWRVAEALAE